METTLRRQLGKVGGQYTHSRAVIEAVVGGCEGEELELEVNG